ncbi:MAG: hypothetical protein R3B40_30655 [Polyangiales bacterium]|nr:hypothetical protein [Myxococcales bacterium]MCB9658728.1 hypothetical protein [Sandaracinaceae bacterium]
MPTDTDDRDVAHTLVQILSACHAAAIIEPVERRSDTPPAISASPADSSFMGQVMSPAGSAIVVADMTDEGTLLALARGGTLAQRRAALARLADLVDYRALSAEHLRIVAEGVAQNRDVELAYEVAAVRARLQGGGRAARAEREAWERLVEQLVADIARFWDGQLEHEPLGRLPGSDRAQVFLRTRDLPDAVVAHISALAEGTDGLLGALERREVLAALRHAADARLVPALVNVLHAGGDALVREAARALGRIDDPRVAPALRAAFDRTAVDATHLVVASALALAGDMRGAQEAAEALTRGEPSLVPFVLEALESLGDREQGDALCAYLDAPDPSLRVRACRTLARVADGRVLAQLDAHRRASKVSAERAELEEAIDAIVARMELRGEEAIVPDPAETRDAAVAPLASRAPFRQRMRAYWNNLVGTLWLAFGAVGRATARFETASQQRPGWAQPLVSMGLAFVRRKEYAQALNAFRRALTAERQRVERNPLVVGPVARAFLRRAEEVERDGRHEIARGLVIEALSLDLRRAPSEVRFELHRLGDALGRRLGE